MRGFPLCNRVFLGKQCWTYASKGEIFWTKVIHGSSSKMRERYGVGVCKNIIMGWDLVSSRVSFEMGNWRIKFWNDR